MDVVIATFEDRARARTFAQALQEVFGVAHASHATIGAQGEPYDGHQLVVAWVPQRSAAEARERAQRIGGLVHPPPARLDLPAASDPPSATTNPGPTVGGRRPPY